MNWILRNFSAVPNEYAVSLTLILVITSPARLFLNVLIQPPAGYSFNTCKQNRYEKFTNRL